MKRYVGIIIIILMGIQSSDAQVGIGYVSGFDIYQRLKNPYDSQVHNAKNSVGSTIINYSIGPKIWLGNAKYSLSLEGQANIGILAFDIQKYRGLTAVSFPLMAKFNTRSMSGFGLMPLPGISIGGGIQYNLTDLLFVSDENKPDRGDWFRTYVIELGLGMGMQGKDGALYFRYGFGEDDSRALHIGIIRNLNYTFNKKFKKKSEDEDKSKSAPLQM